jgi:tetratricopeptide (TPR) repeat protein
VLESLNRDHPESHLVFLNRGAGLEQSGDLQGAGEAYEMALRLTPARYGTLTAVSAYMGRMGDWGRAEELSRRAMDLIPSRDDAYRLLSAQLLRQGRGREAHRVALEGMARGRFHPELWASVSESYVLKGDLAAAVRARIAAAAVAEEPGPHRRRLEELRAALEHQTASQGGEG